MCVCMYMYVYKYVCVYMYVCVCVCIVHVEVTVKCLTKCPYTVGIIHVSPPAQCGSVLTHYTP